MTDSILSLPGKFVPHQHGKVVLHCLPKRGSNKSQDGQREASFYNEIFGMVKEKNNPKLWQSKLRS